jgi:hypothetical protein
VPELIAAAWGFIALPSDPSDPSDPSEVSVGEIVQALVTYRDTTHLRWTGGAPKNDLLDNLARSISAQLKSRATNASVLVDTTSRARLRSNS